MEEIVSYSSTRNAQWLEKKRFVYISVHMYFVIQNGHKAIMNQIDYIEHQNINGVLGSVKHVSMKSLQNTLWNGRVCSKHILDLTTDTKDRSIMGTWKGIQYGVKTYSNKAATS